MQSAIRVLFGGKFGIWGSSFSVLYVRLQAEPPRPRFRLGSTQGLDGMQATPTVSTT